MVTIDGLLENRSSIEWIRCIFLPSRCNTRLAGERARGALDRPVGLALLLLQYPARRGESERNPPPRPFCTIKSVLKRPARRGESESA